MNHTNIINLSQKLHMLQAELKKLTYGAIEIRETQNKKYLYVHYREDGVAFTKYIGEFSDELANTILNNNQQAKQIKKDIKSLQKDLELLGFKQHDLSPAVKTNIDFAKSMLVDTIHKQSVLEGISATFADTQTIVEGGKVNNLTASEVMKVVNLKHAWEFVLNPNVIASDTNFALLSEINRLVLEGFYYNAGMVRSTPVSIGGTSWKPPVPVEFQIKEELQTILDSKLDTLTKAINLLIFVMKRQIFIDGNKRTAVIFANHLLIKNSSGLIAIPDDKVDDYRTLLIEFYETDNAEKITKFLKTQCYTKIN
ncbi:MAG: Fic family protein [Clostridia bacterium]|nr:Fic family protein [Clostridia bacterium]